MLKLQYIVQSFIKIICNSIKQFCSHFHFRADIPRYAILKTIPHQRVIHKHLHTVEIFDLYQLGLFSAPNSLLANLAAVEETKQEILELVELQPQSVYRPHYHKKSSAIIYIVSGTGSLQLGKQHLAYAPGKRIEITAGTLHGFNTYTRTLFLSIQSPPILNATNGYLDLYYENEASDETI